MIAAGAPLPRARGSMRPMTSSTLDVTSPVALPASPTQNDRGQQCGLASLRAAVESLEGLALAKTSAARIRL